MTTDTWLLYVGTVLIFMSTPGPSHLLMLSVSMSNGFHRSLATAAGDLSANAIQILLAGLGLAAVITGSRYGFAIIKWLDVLITSLRRLWFRGFVTSAANPKAVVFFAALFPQFLDPQSSLAPQIAILGATYIVIDGCFLASYGKGASWIAQRLHSQYNVWVDRAAGASLITAAVQLGLRANERT